MLTADWVRPISLAARPKLLCSATTRNALSNFRLTFTMLFRSAGQARIEG